MNQSKDLSLVIPCYNESPHIEASIRELLFCLSDSNLNWEIVFIDDCSPDNTHELLLKFQSLDPRIKVLKNEKNLGRGSTVARGINQSQSTVVGFLDVDLSTSPIYVPYFVKKILNGEADVATALRIYQIKFLQLHKIFVRMMLSIGYRFFSRCVLQHKFKDTETGFKFFNREKIIPIIKLIKDNHWFWDTEVMIYSKIHQLNVIEINTLFDRKPEKKSTVKVFKDTKDYFINVFAFKSRLKKENFIS